MWNCKHLDMLPLIAPHTPHATTGWIRWRLLRIGIYLLLNTVFRSDEDDVTSNMAPVHMCDRTRVKIIARDSLGDQMDTDLYYSCPSKSGIVGTYAR